MAMATTITLPDGYNGNQARFYALPICTDGTLVKLRCAEPGKGYLIAWKCEQVLSVEGESA